MSIKTIPLTACRIEGDALVKYRVHARPERIVYYGEAWYETAGEMRNYPEVRTVIGLGDKVWLLVTESIAQLRDLLGEPPLENDA